MSERKEDINGWFEVARNPISCSGVFEYLGRGLLDGVNDKRIDVERVYRVYRPASELADPDFLDSVRLIPWIDDHTMIGPEELEAMPAEQKGMGGVVGERIEFDAETGTVYANIKCFSETHRNLIESGKADLSLGYRCRYDWTPGKFDGQEYDVIQRTLRGNHLASVDDGRMGPAVAVLDHNDVKGVKMDPEKLKQLLATQAEVQAQIAEALMALVGEKDRADESAGEEKAIAEGEGVDEDDANAEGQDDDDANAEGQDEDADAEREAADADRADADADRDDANADAKDEDDAEGKGTGMDANDVRKLVHAEHQRIRRGAALAKRLSGFVGTFDHSAKTEQQVAEYGVKKLGLSCSKGHEIPTLNGYLAGRKVPGQQRTARPNATAMDSVDNGNTLMAKKLAGVTKQ